MKQENIKISGRREVIAELLSRLDGHIKEEYGMEPDNYHLTPPNYKAIQIDGRTIHKKDLGIIVEHDIREQGLAHVISNIESDGAGIGYDLITQSSEEREKGIKSMWISVERKKGDKLGLEIGMEGRSDDYVSSAHDDVQVIGPLTTAGLPSSTCKSIPFTPAC